MKFSFSQLAVTAFGFFSVVNAAAIRRQEPDVLSYYGGLNIEGFSGTWYLNAMTDITEDIAPIDNVAVDTISHFSMTLESLRLNGNLNMGSVIRLAPPNDQIDVNQNEVLWEMDVSHVEEFMAAFGYHSEGTESAEPTLIYTKLIDSSAQPGDVTLNLVDTILVWNTYPVEGTSDYVTITSILTREANISEQTFASIMAQIPPEHVVTPFINTC
ncbi:hypothetical protein BDB01DRAFT_396447 [Pilobolus umbonatus]|nr:hypothetical protein BDB01DRAFT_396447 [Pilobolus umbonatus]